jgi:hypothetical protein
MTASGAMAGETFYLLDEIENIYRFIAEIVGGYKAENTDDHYYYYYYIPRVLSRCSVHLFAITSI